MYGTSNTSSASSYLIVCFLQDDLPDKRVTHNEIAKFAKDSGFFHWSPVSVKDNRNITESIWLVTFVSPSFPW